MKHTQENSNSFSRLDDLRKLQFDLEKRFRIEILKTDRGPERKRIIREAYAAVNNLMIDRDDYHDHLVRKAKHQILLIQRIFKKRENRKFLDIGCSSGALVIEALKQGYDAYGIDIEEQSIEIAKKRLKDFEDNHERFFCAELSTLKLFDFDLIYSSDLIEHLHPDEMEDFVSEVFHHLRDDGLFIIITPNKFVGPKDISKYFLRKGELAQGLHLKEYSITELDYLLKNAGFDKIKTELINYSYSARLSRLFGVKSVYTYLKMTLESLLKKYKIPNATLLDKLFGVLSMNMVIGIKNGQNTGNNN